MSAFSTAIRRSSAFQGYNRPGQLFWRLLQRIRWLETSYNHFGTCFAVLRQYNLLMQIRVCSNGENGAIGSYDIKNAYKWSTYIYSAVLRHINVIPRLHAIANNVKGEYSMSTFHFCRTPAILIGQIVKSCFYDYKCVLWCELRSISIVSILWRPDIHYCRTPALIQNYICNTEECIEKKCVTQAMNIWVYFKRSGSWFHRVLHHWTGVLHHWTLRHPSILR